MFQLIVTTALRSNSQFFFNSLCEILTKRLNTKIEYIKRFLCTQKANTHRRSDAFSLGYANTSRRGHALRISSRFFPLKIENNFHSQTLIPFTRHNNRHVWVGSEPPIHAQSDCSGSSRPGMLWAVGRSGERGGLKKIPLKALCRNDKRIYFCAEGSGPPPGFSLSRSRQMNWLDFLGTIDLTRETGANRLPLADECTLVCLADVDGFEGFFFRVRSFALFDGSFEIDHLWMLFACMIEFMLCRVLDFFFIVCQSLLMTLWFVLQNVKRICMFNSVEILISILTWFESFHIYIWNIIEFNKN